MVLCVTNIDEMLVLSEDMAQAKRMVELHLTVGSIDKAHLPVTYLTLKLHGFFIHYDKPIVARVSNN